MIKRACDAGIIRINKDICPRPKPQIYYHFSIFADAYRQNVTDRDTEPGPNRRPPGQVATDIQICKMLESDILPMMYGAPQNIHNISFEFMLTPRDPVTGEAIKGSLATEIIHGIYSSIQRRPNKNNKGKTLEKHIDGYHVEYLVYPRGRVIISTETSRRPHRLQAPEDYEKLVAFQAKLEQAFKDMISSTHSALVPPATEWFPIRSDIAIEVEVPDRLQITWPKIQVKHLNYLYRIYAKSLGDRTVMRVETMVKKTGKPWTEYLQEVFTMAGHEKRLTLHEDQITELKGGYESVQKQVAEVKAENQHTRERLEALERRLPQA